MTAVAKVLITRPAGKADDLLATLDSTDTAYIYQPLITTRPVCISSRDKQLLQQADGLFFVSVSAVQALQSQIEPDLIMAPLFAVGETTASALQRWLVKEVIYPDDQRSEGVLALSQLQQVAGKQIVVIRGNGGRELIKQQLQARGATVKYVQSYQRIPLALDGEQLLKQWQQQHVRCIMATSNELLELIFRLLPVTAHAWLLHCYWILVSPRSRDTAIQLGIKPGNIILAANANDQALLDAISLFEREYHE